MRCGLYPESRRNTLTLAPPGHDGNCEYHVVDDCFRSRRESNAAQVTGVSHSMIVSSCTR
ncbi:MAG: hypothetical protein KAJ57_13055 [Woeseiaceae bacterium]|nr:hypothetical protein [Woeseiaceae bacterium]